MSSYFKKTAAISDIRSPERETIEAKLAPWRNPEARGKKRVIIDGNKFTLKCVCG